MLNEFYRIAFRKEIYSDIEMLQQDLDPFMDMYNNQRTQLHTGGRRACWGSPPFN
jgi:hypothetical protein